MLRDVKEIFKIEKQTRCPWESSQNTAAGFDDVQLPWNIQN